jgi:hypothetical protein
MTTAGSFSFWPSISGNGLAVGFSSVADNLVADDYNLEEDVFLSVMSEADPQRRFRPHRHLTRRP